MVTRNHFSTFAIFCFCYVVFTSCTSFTRENVIKQRAQPINLPGKNEPLVDPKKSKQVCFKHESEYYEFHRVSVTWQEAVDECQLRRKGTLYEPMRSDFPAIVNAYKSWYGDGNAVNMFWTKLLSCSIYDIWENWITLNAISNFRHPEWYNYHDCLSVVMDLRKDAVDFIDKRAPFTLMRKEMSAGFICVKKKKYDCLYVTDFSEEKENHAKKDDETLTTVDNFCPNRSSTHHQRICFKHGCSLFEYHLCQKEWGKAKNSCNKVTGSDLYQPKDAEELNAVMVKLRTDYEQFEMENTEFWTQIDSCGNTKSNYFISLILKYLNSNLFHIFKLFLEGLMKKFNFKVITNDNLTSCGYVVVNSSGDGVVLHVSSDKAKFRYMCTRMNSLDPACLSDNETERETQSPSESTSRQTTTKAPSSTLTPTLTPKSTTKTAIPTTIRSTSSKPNTAKPTSKPTTKTAPTTTVTSTSTLKPTTTTESQTTIPSSSTSKSTTTTAITSPSSKPTTTTAPKTTMSSSSTSKSTTTTAITSTSSKPTTTTAPQTTITSTPSFDPTTVSTETTRPQVTSTPDATTQNELAENSTTSRIYDETTSPYTKFTPDVPGKYSDNPSYENETTLTAAISEINENETMKVTSINPEINGNGTSTFPPETTTYSPISETSEENQTETTQETIRLRRESRIYEFHQKPEEWHTATNICQNAGQNMYTPDGTDEIEFLVDELNTEVREGNSLKFWTGIFVCSGSMDADQYAKTQDELQICVKDNATIKYQDIIVESECGRLAIEVNTTTTHFIKLKSEEKLPFICTARFNSFNESNLCLNSSGSENSNATAIFILSPYDLHFGSLQSNSVTENVSQFRNNNFLREKNRYHFTSPLPYFTKVKEKNQYNFTSPLSYFTKEKEKNQHHFTSPLSYFTKEKEKDQHHFTSPLSYFTKEKEKNQYHFTSPLSYFPKGKEISYLGLTESPEPSKASKPFRQSKDQTKGTKIKKKENDENEMRNGKIETRNSKNDKKKNSEGLVNCDDSEIRTEFKSWKIAKTECESDDMELYTPSTIEDIKYYATKLKKCPEVAQNPRIWSNMISCNASSLDGDDHMLENITRSCFVNVLANVTLEVRCKTCGIVAIQFGDNITFHITPPSHQLPFICTKLHSTTDETESTTKFPYCLEKLINGSQWPNVKLGETTYLRCPRGKYGYVSWRCSEVTGRFEGMPKNICRNVDCKKMEADFTDDCWDSYLAERVSYCADKNSKPEDDIKNLMDSVRARRKDFNKKFVGSEGHETSHRDKRLEVVNSALGVYDRLMDDDAKVWDKMNRERRTAWSMDIIKETEETAWLMGCSESSSSMKKENLEIQVVQLELTTKITFDLDDEKEDFANLPADIQPTTGQLCETPVRTAVAASYRTIQKFLLPSSSQYIITSNILGISVGEPNDTYNLSDSNPVRIRLNHPPRSKDTEPKCVFLNWNQSRQGKYGVWDTEGCIADVKETNYTECLCNHLTNFAILMDFTGAGFSKEDEGRLGLVSLIFSVMSSVCLVLTIIIYITVRSLRNRRNTITCNLAACLLAMNILVQIGLKKVGNSVTRCSVISGLLQYCVLTSFMWMLLEGALLYKMVILVFETTTIRLPVIYAVSYGIPFVIILISSSIRPEQMTRDQYCWLSTEKGMIWSVVGPIALVIMVNIIIFAMTVNAAFKIDKVNTNNKSIQKKKNNVMKRLKGMISLTCVLGLTWIVGFFFVPEKPTVSAYLFVTLNGLQGVFLFVTQMVLSDHVRHKLFVIYKENMARFNSVTSTWNSLYPEKQSVVKVSVEEKTLYFSDISPPTQFYTDHNISIYPTAPSPESGQPRSRQSIFKEDMSTRHPFEINYDVT